MWSRWNLRISRVSELERRGYRGLGYYLIEIVIGFVVSDIECYCRFEG